MYDRPRLVVSAHTPATLCGFAQPPRERWIPLGTLDQRGMCAQCMLFVLADEYLITACFYRETRGLCHAVAVRDSFHLQVVTEDHAVETQFFPKQLEHLRRQRRRPRAIDALKHHVRCHDARQPAAQGGKGRQLHPLEPLAIVRQRR
jgi:hypothetical protein